MMQLVNHPISQALERLRTLAASDFTGLALLESHQKARWRYAAGNRSERYKQMLLKPGSGPAGVAFRIGKPVLWDDRAPSLSGLRADCPLITAEQLHSAVAVPISTGHGIKAVLLAARRSPHPYTVQEVEIIENVSKQLLLFIEP
ncbi:GAF domain-containing protein [Xylanibacillus composti]|uniref:GAF domain-containing protein n=1 Tax=Xylanibacillus composti TaxID=1572762 RepID=A0A8J4H226_9BACL|nr:GAF domain-containing protein [Xylanibacillus composti]MDT9726967.1 GAF domain-containing protein [Xylanibacillus composti]GIQ69523.1 hypothetical protein XYCOK13_23470 [Xylanibacillus composti]